MEFLRKAVLSRFGWLVGLAVLILATALGWQQLRTRRDGESRRLPGLQTERASDRGANSRPAASYVGSRRCIECHPEQHASYLETSHSRSFVDVDPAREPAGGDFTHDLSQSYYQIYRAEGELRHAESLLSLGGDQEPSNDQPLRYRVGSGHVARTYLFESDGFLLESPLTWYERDGAWGMSPGYDRTHHSSFQRIISDECLFCHAGRVELVDGNPYRPQIVEPAIACERCHGPGSLHVDRQTAGILSRASGADETIVNPNRLPRKLSEDICAQCHLQGDVAVSAAGQEFSDYRPGLPLEQFRHHYRLQDENREMTVVGHVEQMRLSPCYQESQTLTCLTCHDPHRPVRGQEASLFYQSVCLQCHQEDGCTEPLPRRLEVAENECVTCHMPTAPTEVTHVAFTHHRIGIHGAAGTEPGTPAANSDSKVLVPLQDLTTLSRLEQDRSLGLAYLRLEGDAAGQPDYLRRGWDLLQGVYAAGVQDPAVRAALAQLALYRGESATAEAMASRVLSSVEEPVRERVDALEVLARIRFQQQRFEEARDLYAELVACRRTAKHWFYLGLCEQNCGRTAQALQALHQSLTIDPRQAGAHSALAVLYGSIGRPEEAEQHRERAARLGE